MSNDAAPPAAERLQRPWHAVPVEQVLHELETATESGLGESEVERRRRAFGPNALTPASERTALKRFVSQFNNLFIWLLLAAGAITASLGEWVDSGVIFGVVLIIAIIGFVQEGRAARALEAVRGMLSPTAHVVRGGRRLQIPAEALVPGDVVLLDAGDRVPADVRLIQARNLHAQEAALTGESTSVEKTTNPVAEDAELGDRASLAFAGTLITAGRGRGVVVAIGDGTEIGRISGMLSTVENVKTPLAERLDAFTKALSVAIMAIAAVTFGVGVFVWGRDGAEMFFAAVSVAVAAIPEGLPAVMTVTLAIGVERMARRNAIIRRLPAVETLGAVTVVCADKTGTLTRNEMTVRAVRTATADLEVDGVGYDPHGDFLLEGRAVGLEDHPAALEMIRAGVLCNDATLVHEPVGWKPQGDPTEAALIVVGHKADLPPERENEERPRIDVIPFASERRYMATLHHDHQGNHFAYVKGAPERVLEMCREELRGEEVVALDAERWKARADELAARGQRVLAVARKPIACGVTELREEAVEADLILLGLFGLIDPPREEAIRAVATCRSAGIRVKMITGDHVLTARAVAEDLGLEHTDKALSGRELEQITDEALLEHAMDVDVFARASPEHKLRLVKALQARRQITGMTGDGVNDAPALKRADIGIAMGLKGTEVAREAAEMVLADDNFASIERAILEGRTVYDNLRKAILFILPTNAAQALIIVSAIVMGLVLPVTPVQILWVNMITAVTLGIAFAWERAEGDIMRRPPRPTSEPLLTPFILWRIAFVGLLLLLGAGILFVHEQARADTSLELARTIAVNALVMGQIFYLLNARFFRAPAFTVEGLFGSQAVLMAIAACLLLQLLFTYLPLMNTLFGTEPLDLTAWARCVAVGLGIFVLVEVEKAWLRRAPAGGEPVLERT